MNTTQAIGRQVARHSLFWLVAANAVGVWLAAVLVWPALGDLLGSFSYGCWMPLHLNWQLYGWCTLPLLGVLLLWQIDERHPRAKRHSQWLLGTWSLALGSGGLLWLTGSTSGKPFLDWEGFGRVLLPGAMIVGWTIFAAHAWWRWPDLARSARVGRVVALAILVMVPPVFYLATGRDYYPAVNPDSGGATGASLLGSTLAVVSLYGALPWMLGLERVRTTDREFGSTFAGRPRPLLWFPVALAVSWLVYAVISHRSVSHHDGAQIAGLGTLGLWVPLLVSYTRSFTWPDGARRWLRASFGWWLLLCVTGWMTFLPGLSERLKFTNALVAHAHLAMAGLVTSVNGVLLGAAGNRLGRGRSFWLWQIGCAVHVAALMAIGMREYAEPGALFRAEAWTEVLYALRLGTGLAMFAASWQWWQELRR